MAWRTYNTIFQDRRALVCFDDQFAERAPLNALSDCFWLGIWCRLEPGTAFWHPNESAELDRIEREFLELAQVHSHGWAVYVRRAATKGIREHYLYASPNAELERAHALLLAKTLSYRIDCERTPDPEWHHYKQWLAEPRHPLSA